jgi:hypothetical protein
MALAKIMGGWYLNSMILAADGWHSMTDLITDALTLVTISTKHNRIKQMGSMGLAFILMSGGVHMGWESLQALQLDFYPAAAPTMEDKALHRPLPSVHAAWIAFATILVKEWLYYESEHPSPTHKYGKDWCLTYISNACRPNSQLSSPCFERHPSSNGQLDRHIYSAGHCCLGRYRKFQMD